jgi:hypothetical protein
VLVAPVVANADDRGKPADVAAIRHDLPILLSLNPATTIESVDAIDGTVAYVGLHTGDEHTTIFFRKRYGRWWYRGVVPVIRYDQPSPVPCATPLCVKSVIGDSLLTIPPPFRGDVRFETGIRSWFTDDYYRVTLRFAPNDSSEVAKVTDFTTRGPTEAESWIARGGNSYFFFSATVQSPQPIHVRAGTTFDVWFPFVLDPSLTYSLTIGGAGFTPIGPIDGTLTDNTLHFVLPVFTAPPGVDMMGEIESN